jgi:hypothetical protein
MVRDANILLDSSSELITTRSSPGWARVICLLIISIAHREVAAIEKGLDQDASSISSPVTCSGIVTGA